jgi:hypothetical protein
MCKICQPTRFTADDARDASEAGEPIMIDCFVAYNFVVEDHGLDWDDFKDEIGDFTTYDAWTVLAWLGY